MADSGLCINGSSKPSTSLVHTLPSPHALAPSPYLSLEEQPRICFRSKQVTQQRYQLFSDVWRILVVEPRILRWPRYPPPNARVSLPVRVQSNPYSYAAMQFTRQRRSSLYWGAFVAPSVQNWCVGRAL